MIYRLTRPAELEQVRAFIVEALRTDPLVLRPEKAYSELRERISDKTCGVFVARGSVPLEALLIADANTSEFSSAVVVIHIYNRGNTATLRDLFRAMEVFKNEHGLSRVHGIDINKRPRAYRRLFRLGGWTAKPVGMFYEFTEAANGVR